MGNTVVWKPAPTQQFAAHFLMRLLEAAGLPPGVINMVHRRRRRRLRGRAGRPATWPASTSPARPRCSSTCGGRSARTSPSYRGYPRIVGETGGKDFVVAHPSADVDVLRTALVRGAFEYQGQKCSAASRAYVPRSAVGAAARRPGRARPRRCRWATSPTSRTSWARSSTGESFAKLSGVLDRAQGRRRADRRRRRHAPTTARASSSGRPIIEGTDPAHEVFTTEYFGPVLAVHVYDDADYDAVLTQMESVAPYALTGSIIAQDRAAIAHAQQFLRYAAGNFYVNDKPTGAVVGQQPFGGGRASGTNDKAGAPQNLHALDQHPVDQGDVRPADRPPLPAHGLTRA